jgi:hypothetical protein
VAREKLFKPKPPDDDRQEPHERFRTLATKVLSVPKREIEERIKKVPKAKQRQR